MDDLEDIEETDQFLRYKRKIRAGGSRKIPVIAGE